MQTYPVGTEIQQLAAKVKELIFLKYKASIANAYRILQGM